MSLEHLLGGGEETSRISLAPRGAVLNRRAFHSLSPTRRHKHHQQQQQHLIGQSPERHFGSLQQYTSSTRDEVIIQDTFRKQASSSNLSTENEDDKIRNKGPNRAFSKSEVGLYHIGYSNDETDQMMRTGKTSSLSLCSAHSKDSRRDSLSSSPRRRRLPRTPESRPRCQSVYRPSGKLQGMLKKFTDLSVPFHLCMIQSHKERIEQFLSLQDNLGVQREVELASLSVRRLGTVIFEMEVLRSYLAPSEWPYFDAKVIPAKTKALLAVQQLLAVCPKHGEQPEKVNFCARNSEERRNAESRSQEIVIKPVQSSSENCQNKRQKRGFFKKNICKFRSASCSRATSEQLDILYEHPREDSMSVLSDNENFIVPTQNSEDKEDSWSKLEQEIRDIHHLIAEFSKSNLTECQQEDQQHQAQTRQQENQQVNGTAIYPLAGAFIGTCCLGGPVGFLAGAKLGSLAAIGGSVFGYSTGILIKEQKDRQDYIEEFYANHPNAPRPMARYADASKSTPNLAQKSTKRAQSLPDVLDECSDRKGPLKNPSSTKLPKYHQRIVIRKTNILEAKSEDNLLS